MLIQIMSTYLFNQKCYGAMHAKYMKKGAALLAIYHAVLLLAITSLLLAVINYVT
jgi:hypothetical protein